MHWKEGHPAHDIVARPSGLAPLVCHPLLIFKRHHHADALECISLLACRLLAPPQVDGSSQHGPRLYVPVQRRMQRHPTDWELTHPAAACEGSGNSMRMFLGPIPGWDLTPFQEKFAKGRERGIPTAG